jgi:hypothetical protein
VKPATLAAERQLEEALEVVRGVKACLCGLATMESDENNEIFCYLGQQLAKAHEQAVHAYGRIFFGADKQAAE